MNHMNPELTMDTRIVRTVVAAALVTIPATLPAQRTIPTVARLTPYVGYMTFGNYLTGPIGTRISNQPTAVYGAELGIDVSPNVALVGNIGYADSNIQVGLPIIGGISIADSKVLMYDGGVQLRLPATTALGSGLVPFVQGGAGAIRYEVRTGPLKTQATNFALNAAAGVDLQLSRAIGVRGMVKDYIGKFDFQEATSLNLSSKVAHNWVYGVGLSLGF